MPNKRSSHNATRGQVHECPRGCGKIQLCTRFCGPDSSLHHKGSNWRRLASCIPRAHSRTPANTARFCGPRLCLEVTYSCVSVGYRYFHGPVPNKGTSCGLPPPSSLMLRVALLSPFMMGLNASFMAQLASG